MSENNRSRIKGIFSDVLSVPIEKITLSTSPKTIETWDSLNHLNLVLALEQEFAVEFVPEDIDQLLSVEQAVILIEEKLFAANSLV